MNNQNPIRLTFGKYDGNELQDVPTDYLQWLTANTIPTWLRRSIEEELETRAGHNSPRFVRKQPKKQRIQRRQQEAQPLSSYPLGAVFGNLNLVDVETKR